MSEPSEFLSPWWEVEKKDRKTPKPPKPPVRKEQVIRKIRMSQGDINNFRVLVDAVSSAAVLYAKYGVASFSDFSLGWEGEYDAAEPVLEFITTETDEELAVRQKKYEVKLAKWEERHKKYQQ